MDNSLAWRSPSNIALIKYWGKFGRQEPRNASISFTLDAAHSDTRLMYTARAAGDDRSKLSIRFVFEGQENLGFAARVDKFLSSILDEMPFLRDYHLDIASHNSFPHSAGIASSASGLSALALCVVDMAQKIGFANWSEAEFRQKASHFSRLASGSACRSVYGGAAIWGTTPHYADASNLYAVGFDADLHPIFKTYRNDILFVSKAEKKVSSTAGHELMNGNPFAQARYQQAGDNLGILLDHLRTGEVDAAGAIIEEEALTLHALMMSSRPSFLLLQPATILLIHKLRAWREDTKLPLYFSLDAGPNLHMLYPEAISAQAQDFIAAELLPHCENQQFLADKVGAGAIKLIV
jgi:diphosphomevalonate decarboxylase